MIDVVINVKVNTWFDQTFLLNRLTDVMMS